MALSNLPIELVHLLITDFVRCTGVREAVKARLVCKVFDRVVQDALYDSFLEEDTPYRDLDKLSVFHLSKEMTARLIIRKLASGNCKNRRLCIAIQDAAKCLISQPNGNVDKHSIFEEALAKAAADSLLFCEVVQSLSTTCKKHESTQEILVNALCAATYTNQLPHVEALLTMGVDPSAKSQHFGRPLSAAARMGSKQLVEIFLERDCSDGSIYDALRAAALAGNEHVVWIILRHVKVGSPTLDDIIISAARAKRIAVVQTMLQSRLPQCQPDPHESALERGFWHNLFRTAAEIGSVNLITTIAALGHSIDDNLVELMAEDACRNGHDKTIDWLLSHTSNHDVFYTGALFCAARDGKESILEMILSRMNKRDLCTYADVLCGAYSGRNMHIAQFVLRTLGIDALAAQIECASAGFHGMIDMLLTAMIELTTSQINSPIRDTEVDEFGNTRHMKDPCYEWSVKHGNCPIKIEPIAKAVIAGDFRGVWDVLRRHRPPELSINYYTLQCAFAKSVRHDRPGMLLYLSKYVSRTDLETLASGSPSPAVLQILLDLGWDINKEYYRISPPLLAFGVEDIFRIQWFLDHGADPNATCGWDLNPMSFAMVEPPLSHVQFLFERGGNIKHGQLLHHAIRRKHDVFEILDLLLNLGADVNAMFYSNDPQAWAENKYFGIGTPLHEAVELDALEIVIYLLERGADTSILNSLGKTAMDRAVEKGHSPIIEVLRQF